MPSKPSITAHMVVKNDDQWVWYAVKAILPFVTKFFITDTGSSDATIAMIQLIKDKKIVFTQSPVTTPEEVVSVRQAQVEATQTDWLWMVDADEIYPAKVSQEIIDHLDPRMAGVVVRRYDCLGDIFHYQPNEAVGGYGMFGKTAHYSLRIINHKLTQPHLTGAYPNEGFYDQQGLPLISYPRSLFYITKGRYLHTTYLKRSSLGSNLTTTIHRQKYKVELGKPLVHRYLPEIFRSPIPQSVPKPHRRSWLYTARASLFTPLKVMKRTLAK